MATSSLPPHLSPAAGPTIYPATKQAFRGCEPPEIQIFLTRTKKIIVKVSWGLTAAVLVAVIIAIALSQPSLIRLLATLFVFLLCVSVVLTVKLQPGGLMASWNEYLNSLSVYSAVLAYSSGLYVRRNGNEQDFTFLPWSVVTAISLNDSSDLVFGTSASADSVLHPEEQMAHTIVVSLAGAMLNGFTPVNTPEHSVESLRLMLEKTKYPPANSTEVQATPISAANKIKIIGFALILLLIGVLKLLGLL